MIAAQGLDFGPRSSILLYIASNITRGAGIAVTTLLLMFSSPVGSIHLQPLRKNSPGLCLARCERND